MGNRAVITTRNQDIGVYLHWNGGIDSVIPFLMYCKLKQYTSPESDNYGWARLCQVIGNFFGGTVSLGIDKYECLDTDNGDNGVYIIENWQIVRRDCVPAWLHEERPTKEHVKEFMLELNKAQPEEGRVEEKLLCDFVDSNYEESL